MRRSSPVSAFAPPEFHRWWLRTTLAGLTDSYASAITPDGKTLVFTYLHKLSDLYVVEGLK
jgi:hypothetical protein